MSGGGWSRHLKKKKKNLNIWPSQIASKGLLYLPTYLTIEPEIL